MKINEILLRSGATSLFDVRHWTFDVGRSSFKPIPYGINATCEHIQNNLALMGAWSMGHCALRKKFGNFFF
jgi:hypothetical protein